MDRMRSMLLVLLCLPVITGCKIKIETPAEGYVENAEGDLVCASNSSCIISVTDTRFETEFVAVANEGYFFSGWKRQHKSLCGGRRDTCLLQTFGIEGNPDLEAVLASDEEFYLIPTFVDLKPAEAQPQDVVVTVTAPELSLLGEEQVVEVRVENVSAKAIEIGYGAEIFVDIDDFGRHDLVNDDWTVTSDFGDCRFQHIQVRSLYHSARGESYRCTQSPLLLPGESAELQLKITLRDLAHHVISGYVGDGFRTVMKVHPSLEDSDGDGAIDVEESLSNSDPYDANSFPSSSVIDFLAIYTPAFADVHNSAEERRAYFEDFVVVANQIFADSLVRITLNLVGVVGAEQVDSSPTRFQMFPSDAALRKNGFEFLGTLAQALAPDVVAIVGHDKTNKLFGSADHIMSGTQVGYFSAPDNYGAMLIGLAHNLGAGRHYTEHDSQFVAELRDGHGTFSFSQAYLEGSAGTLMSQVENILPVFSNPLLTDCSLSLCGVAGYNFQTAADNALTLNLRRHFMENTAILDSNFDGMPDWWAQKHGFIGDFERCTDADGDGVANVEEYWGLSDPNDADSVPTQVSEEGVCEAPMSRTVEFRTERGQLLEMDLRTRDAFGQFLEITPDFDPTHGKLDWDMYGYGIYLYDPDPDFEGMERLEFTLRNGMGGRASLRVNVTVGR